MQDFVYGEQKTYVHL